MKYTNILISPFRYQSRIDFLLLGVFLIINLIVFANAINHNPKIGYDAGAHAKYVKALSTFELVRRDQSREFFSPPLPYLLPALIYRSGASLNTSIKAAQLFNVPLSMLLLWFMIKICRILSRHRWLPVLAISLTGMIPAYYKTFAMFRAEVWVSLLVIICVYLMIRTLKKQRISIGDATLIGLCMGLCALSRQWGILTFPAVYFVLAYFWWRKEPRRNEIYRTTLIISIVIALVSSWFYLNLKFEYGKFTAFNRGGSSQFSFSNQPPEFYYDMGLDELFTHPVRPSFSNRPIPILYADTWGDYWAFYLISSKNLENDKTVNGFNLWKMITKGALPESISTNYYSMAKTLARVNLVSILPTALALLSLIYIVTRIAYPAPNTRRGDWETASYLLMVLAIFFTAIGYSWFLIKYPNHEKGDTIKATYVAHIYPLVALTCAIMLNHIRTKAPKLYYVLCSLLGGCFLHNLPVLFTRY